MNCEQTQWEPYVKRNEVIKCNSEATERLWCPTWIRAEDGPMNLCAECAKHFKPEFNKYAKDGAFYWGADADTQYQLYLSRPRCLTCQLRLTYNAEIAFPGAGQVWQCKRCLKTYVVIGKQVIDPLECPKNEPPPWELSAEDVK